MAAPRMVIVTPGRVAYTSPKAKEKFTSKPKAVVWNAYLQELLTVHGDIQIVGPRAVPAAPGPVAVAKPALNAASLAAAARHPAA